MYYISLRVMPDRILCHYTCCAKSVKAGFSFRFFSFLPFSAKWDDFPKRWGAWVEVYPIGWGKRCNNLWQCAQGCVTGTVTSVVSSFFLWKMSLAFWLWLLTFLSAFIGKHCYEILMRTCRCEINLACSLECMCLTWPLFDWTIATMDAG